MHYWRINMNKLKRINRSLSGASGFVDENLWSVANRVYSIRYGITHFGIIILTEREFEN